MIEGVGIGGVGVDKGGQEKWNEEEEEGEKEEKNEARIFNYGENELPGLENAAAMKADVQMYRCHRCDRFTGV